MAKFKKGETPPGAVPFSEETAKEMQRRSAASRKANRSIAEMLRTYLDEPGGGGYTRGEILVMKAVNNHKDGKLTFKDLRDLSRILGEDVLNIKTDGTPIQVVVGSSEAADGLRVALQNGAQPINPENE